jgi:hypothetical protein
MFSYSPGAPKNNSESDGKRNTDGKKRGRDRVE